MDEGNSYLDKKPAGIWKRRFLVEFICLFFLLGMGLQLLTNDVLADRADRANKGKGGGKASTVSAVITSPVNNATVHGTVPVFVSASSTAAGIKSVNLKVNGIQAADSNMTPPYITTFRSWNCVPGPYSLSVVVVDLNGNQTTSLPVTVNVVPPLATDDIKDPEAMITSLTQWQVIKGVVPITVTASDNIGVVKIDLYIDSNPVISVDPASPTYNWDTSVLRAGSYHNVNAIVWDAAYNKHVAGMVTVKIGN